VAVHPAIAHDTLSAAARIAGLSSVGAEFIRDGTNVMYRLQGGVVARIGRDGAAATATKEVAVSRWLTAVGIPVVKPLEAVPQPVIVDNRPVTWWKLLPDHRPANPAELGKVLRMVHGLAIPSGLELPTYDPFEGLDQRIRDTHGLDRVDRTWLSAHVEFLRSRHENQTQGVPRTVIHGDAWQGNVAVPESGEPILLDLEKVAIGHPDIDLVNIAVDYTDFARLTDEDYRSFVDAYGGYDVTTTSTYRTLADIQELRWVSFVLGKSATSSDAARETRHRIACLRGDQPRPWSWTAF